jgi:hypothetical protein
MVATFRPRPPGLDLVLLVNLVNVTFIYLKLRVAGVG